MDMIKKNFPQNLNLSDLIRHCFVRWTVVHLKSRGPSAANESPWSAQSQLGHLYHNFSPGLRAHPRRGGGKMSMTEVLL